MKKEDAIKSLVAAGATVVNDAKVMSASVDFNGDFERGFISIKVDKPVKRYVDGELVEVDYMNVSLISACAALKDEVGSGVYHHLKACPYALEDIYDGSTVSVYQSDVKANEPYVNPFSDTAKPVVDANPRVYNNIGSVTMSKDGRTLVKQIKMFRNFGAGIVGMM